MDPAAHEAFRSQMFAARTRKLLLDAHLLCERSAELYAKAHLIVQRDRIRVAQTRRLLESHEQRRAARLLQETIFEKVEAGLLPEAGAPIVYGEPGAGGRCAACDDVLAPTQLMMSVQWPSRGTSAHLHADCFMAWNAVRRSRAALARTA
jgi:hypothetical protein